MIDLGTDGFIGDGQPKRRGGMVWRQQRRGSGDSVEVVVRAERGKGSFWDTTS